MPTKLLNTGRISLVVGAVALLASCGGSSGSGGRSCPALEDAPQSGKVSPEVGYAEAPSSTFSVIVALKADPAVSVQCANGEATCPDRDEALLARLEEHQRRFACVQSTVGYLWERRWWYEEPQYLTSGDPADSRPFAH